MPTLQNIKEIKMSSIDIEELLNDPMLEGYDQNCHIERISQL